MPMPSELGGETLLGGEADDHLQGGSAHDQLDGAGGNDVLHAGAGDDSVTGGGDDRIVDFNAGADVVRIDGAVPYTLEQVDEDVVITLASGATLTLEGVDLATLPEAWITH